jgi:membrane associated rhomboid family serine protease
LTRREPIFNVPGVVLLILGVCCLVHVVRWLLPADGDGWLTTTLAFIPMRLLPGVAAQLPGGEPATITSFVTHLFVHGDTTHLIINMAWLLAFGSPSPAHGSSALSPLFWPLRHRRLPLLCFG